MQRLQAILAGVALSWAAGAAARAESTPVITSTVTPLAAPEPPPPPYSLPWQLRPISAGTVLRSDTSVALYENAAGDSGATTASMLTGTYKISPSLAPLLKLGMVQNSEPGPALGSAAALVNPLVGLTYARPLHLGIKAAGFAGVTIPVGMGGDKAAGADATAAAVMRGINARAAMDNAMFAVDYTTLIGGLDLAWVSHKVTLQAEATLFQLFRTRNEMFAPDRTRTNLTAGVHAGVFPFRFLSLGAELRHQRWLSTPKMIVGKAAARDTTTVAIGPRFHFKAGGLWFRPGISYAAALDSPAKDLGYHIVQLDVPVAF